MSMKSIKLNIIRKKSYLGAVVPYSVYLNDVEIVKLPNGRRVSLDVPADNKFLLTISILKKNSFVRKITPHSALSSKTVMIHPEYCKNGIVNCTITTHANIIGAVSLGFLSPQTDLNVRIDYN